MTEDAGQPSLLSFKEASEKLLTSGQQQTQFDSLAGGDLKEMQFERADVTAAFAFNFGSEEGNAGGPGGNAPIDTTPAFAAEGKLAKIARDIVIE